MAAARVAIVHRAATAADFVLIVQPSQRPGHDATIAHLLRTPFPLIETPTQFRRIEAELAQDSDEERIVLGHGSDAR